MKTYKLVDCDVEITSAQCFEEQCCILDTTKTYKINGYQFFCDSLKTFLAILA